MANEKLGATYTDYAHGTTPGSPDSGYVREYYKNDNKKYKKTSAGTESEVSGAVDIDAESSYGSPPDESIVFLAQSIGTQDFWKLTGDEMRTWLSSDVNDSTGSFSTNSRSEQQFVFDSATDRTVTINSSTPAEGHHIRAYAIAVSGGTGHKILLPAGVYWGRTGTNRAVLLAAADAYVDALCHSVAGTLRFLMYPSDNATVTYAAS